MSYRIDDMPFRIGQRVTIKPSICYAKEFPGEWIITSMRWEFTNRPDSKTPGNWINLGIASDEGIEKGRAETDGWSASDFDAVVSDSALSEV